jgi:hypothetical protein
MIGTRRFENDQHAAVGNPPEESSQSSGIVPETPVLGSS